MTTEQSKWELKNALYFLTGVAGVIAVFVMLAL